jgi:hypothetical protein
MESHHFLPYREVVEFFQMLTKLTPKIHSLITTTLEYPTQLSFLVVLFLELIARPHFPNHFKFA